MLKKSGPLSLKGLMVGVCVAGMTVAAAQSYDDLLNPPAGEWPQYGRDVQESRFSPLDQINRDNVDSLEMAWARSLEFNQAHQGSPSVWDGIMYVAIPSGVRALDATNGELVWEVRKPNPGSVMSDSAARGAPLVFEGNVYFNTAYGSLVAVDAKSGEDVFSVQLTTEELNEGFTTNPIVANGNIVVGVTGADSGGAPGRILALDPENGDVLWTFNTVPLDENDPAIDTWPIPPSWEAGIGGASPWNAGAYDPVTNTVIYGTGQPTPWDRVDYRRYNDGEPMSNLYTASFVALDADTGELNWYHQVVPGDEWDGDQHIVPIIADIEFDGEERHVALLATTTGYVVVIDMETGDFLAGHPIAEEHTMHIGYTEDGKAIINPDVRFTEEGQLARICPGLRWAHIAPGAFSPETGLLYRPNQMACVNMGPKLLPSDWEPGERAWFSESGPRDESYWFDRLGALSAIDPVTGEVVWEFSHDYGHDAGPVVTAGGLVFTSSHDRRIRALDAENGEVLWQHVLTSGARGGTITYEVDGTQYVATIIGMGTPNTGDIPDYNPHADVAPPVAGEAAIFVFALP